MSGGSGQRTLFQAWGAPVSDGKVVHARNDGKKAAGRRKKASDDKARVPAAAPRNPLWAETGQRSAQTSGSPEGDLLEEDDDSLMLVAVYEAEHTLNCQNANDQEGAADRSLSTVPSAGKTYPDFPGFDSSSADVWIYPTNYPIRDYQLKISEAALYRNTMVCLPTGLGKTFIASVVMYNFYRWYPSGKIVFMAPTKPLVAQQIEACYKVMGIPQAHMAELTGSTAANKRQAVWRSNRVFFLTPQVMMNDLSRDSCPAQQVKCVVIDEAHKALGNHAYCQVIRQLASQNLHFRILALSATPGGDTKSVQSVISNLLISHIELRSDESPDIQAYSHQRNVEKLVVPLGEMLSAYQDRYLQVLEKFMSRLIQNKVMAHKDLRILTKYQLILARDQFRKNPPTHTKGPQQGMLEGDFALCISLYHGYELLMQMGLRSLFFYIQGIMDGTREMSRARNELQRTPIFMELYEEMVAIYMKPSAGQDEPFMYSHPKLKKLEEVVLHHFRMWVENVADNNGSDGPLSTRVMIFSSFRESVQEIAAMLHHHAPMIRVMTFMGQASAGKGVKGFTQKEQLEVVNKFRQGGFNTLVSTCVGEEGLDIGEVDLIVCFDAQKNPTRLVQRMGRTGRKRKGRIVVILAEGREERTYNQSQSNKRSVFKSIVGNKSGFHLYPNSPRMLPEGLNPTLHKMHITCVQFDPRESSRRSVRAGRRSHCEGRVSLIHPQNLSCKESEMQAGEAYPTLKRSCFVSLPQEPCFQEATHESRPPSRELSLWEWRHWQHRALPTHAVDHSLRCQHFIKVMELIDQMKEESEGECRYEQDLLPYLNKTAHSPVKGVNQEKIMRKRLTGTKMDVIKPNASSDLDLEDKDEKTKRRNPHGEGSALSSTKPTPVIQHDSEASRANETNPSPPHGVCPPKSEGERPGVELDECGDIIEIRDNKQADSINSEVVDLNQLTKVDNDNNEAHPDEGIELQAMFYLPKWNLPHSPSTKLLQGEEGRLNDILSRVAELLSRSPPLSPLDFATAVTEPTEPTPPRVLQEDDPHQTFQVNFALDVDDDDEVIISDGFSSLDKSLGDKESRGDNGDWVRSRCNEIVNSPTWDDVFGDEEEHDNHGPPGDRTKNCAVTEAGEEGERSGLDEVKSDGTLGQTVADMNDNIVSQMEDSMDLFEDDEVFLQMTIPDIHNPEGGVGPRTSPVSQDIIPTTNKGSTTNPPVNPCLLGRTGPETQHTHTAAPREHATDASSSAQNTLHPDTSPAPQPGADSFDRSRDYFPVNFDLGYSLDSEEDDFNLSPDVSSPAPPGKDPAFSWVALGVSGSSTPSSSRQRQTGLQHIMPRFSSPPSLSEHWKKETSSILTSPAAPNCRAPPVPVASQRRMNRVVDDSWPCAPHRSPSPIRLKRRRLEGPSVDDNSNAAHLSCQELPPTPPSAPHPAEGSADSEDEVVHHRRQKKKINPLLSPEMTKILEDVDSPLVASKKRGAALPSSDEEEGRAFSDDFHSRSLVTRRRTPARQRVVKGKTKRNACRIGRQFLDEEAELSEDGRVAVSSDEEDEDDRNHSLDGFVVDGSHLSQGLNDSEMQGVYMKSVRSPSITGRFKMSYKAHHNVDIFSQVPEMDETYAEDSFVVGSDVEDLESCEEEAEEESIELLPEDSYVDGRKQYATRRRVFLHKARAESATTRAASPEQTAGAKTRRGRVLRITDSSEEEPEEAVTAGDVADPPRQGVNVESRQPKAAVYSSTIASKISLLSRAQGDQQGERCRHRIEEQHALSDQLDFEKTEMLFQSKEPQLPPAVPSPAGPLLSIGEPVSAPPVPAGPICILMDSRCISSSVALMTSLRQRHGVTVHVCSLDGTYFIVSNRMAVERHNQSDLAALHNRKRLAERVSSMLRLFERVCLIVERDRAKKGESSHPFQRTRCYDSTLVSLVNIGVRLLWSDSTEESASLLVELAQLERRKGQGITAPLEVKGQHGQQTLQLYLSLPSVSHVHALNMCHNFTSVGQLINSSIEDIQKGGCMGRSRAEEIYRFLRHSCDPFLLNTS